MDHDDKTAASQDVHQPDVILLNNFHSVFQYNFFTSYNEQLVHIHRFDLVCANISKERRAGENQVTPSWE